MNEFLVHHNLCNLHSHINRFPDGKKVVEELQELIEQFSSRSYKVAVIGEFKRGKSSLINALLGTQILPTDILPTTAVINRIRYATEQKIMIYYKNGEIQESSIESLSQYATKLDKEKELFSETIREIVVQYPTVFGQKHIEVIDTPGLNDNEAMTEITLNVLGEIDTAIVVISATMPLSMTEQKLIAELIKQDNIYNLVFAVTFIDRVSDEVDEQDRVVSLIKNRLSVDTYELFCQSHSEEALEKKAKRILENPNVFAVSSKQAMDGFVKGKHQLLEKSRFKDFKYNLFTLLTANQENDCVLKIQRICKKIETNVASWSENYQIAIKTELQNTTQRIQELEKLADSAQDFLNEKLLELEENIEQAKYNVLGEDEEADLVLCLKEYFILKLSSLRRSSFNENTLLAAIQEASELANLFAKPIINKLAVFINRSINAVSQELMERYGFVNKSLGREEISIDWKENSQFISEFCMDGFLIVNRMSHLNDECMPFVLEEIQMLFSKISKEIWKYESAYRLAAIKYTSIVKESIQKELERFKQEIEKQSLVLEKEKILFQDEQNQVLEILQKIYEEVS